jgi:hypothetical protein
VAVYTFTNFVFIFFFFFQVRCGWTMDPIGYITHPWTGFIGKTGSMYNRAAFSNSKDEAQNTNVNTSWTTKVSEYFNEKLFKCGNLWSHSVCVQYA